MSKDGSINKILLVLRYKVKVQVILSQECRKDDTFSVAICSCLVCVWVCV